MEFDLTNCYNEAYTSCPLEIRKPIHLSKIIRKIINTLELLKAREKRMNARKICVFSIVWCTWWRSCLRHCATSRMIADSIFH